MLHYVTGVSICLHVIVCVTGVSICLHVIVCVTCDSMCYMCWYVLHMLLYTTRSLKFYVASFWGFSQNIFPTKLQHMVDVNSSLV